MFGGEDLLQLLKNYSRSLNMKTAITVGIVGYPNVGKSSVINSLKRTRAVFTGSTPGLTTTAQVRDSDPSQGPPDKAPSQGPPDKALLTRPS